MRRRSEVHARGRSQGGAEDGFDFGFAGISEVHAVFEHRRIGGRKDAGRGCGHDRHGGEGAAVVGDHLPLEGAGIAFGGEVLGFDGDVTVLIDERRG